MLSSRELATLLLFKNKPDNFFRLLPKDIIMESIGGIHVKNAFNFLFNIDYVGLINLLQIKPHLMFVEVPMKISCSKRMMSLVQMALYLLDNHAWDICYSACLNHSDQKYLLDQFKTQAKNVNDCIDVKPLFDDYDIYIKSVHAFKEAKMDVESLLFFWLAVGRAQRDVLPLHMLRYMCMLALSMQILTEDVALVRCEYESGIDEPMLECTASHHEVRNIIIEPFYGKDNALARYYLYYRKTDLNDAQWKWTVAKIAKSSSMFGDDGFSYQNLFPNERNQSIRYTFDEFRQSGEQLKLDFRRWPLYPWSEGGLFALTQSVVYMLQQKDFEKFEKLTLAEIRAKLGVKYTLARGYSALCFATSAPAGLNEFLGYKAADDKKYFERLYADLQELRQEFVSSLEPASEPSAIAKNY
jgi:hypothetical protein